jgi:hypothetical protein
MSAENHHKPESTSFPKLQEPPQNSKHQKGNMQQVLPLGPTNITFHHSKFSRLYNYKLLIFHRLGRLLRPAIQTFVNFIVPTYVFALCSRLPFV